MSTVDWSKAPTGALAYHPGSSHQFECWYKFDANGDVLCALAHGAYLNIWTHMGGRKDFPFGAITRF